MIDYEVKIFNTVHATVAPLCANKKFTSTMMSSPPTAFPTASLIEIDNRTVRSRQSSTPIENYSLLTYQLDVFATSKSECKSVFSAADDALIAMNFTRTSAQYISMPNNTDVFRYTARYQAWIDRDGNMYRM